MKLIDFHTYKPLTNLLKEMGAELIDYSSEVNWLEIDDDKLAELLRSGEVEIPFDEIEIQDGVFSFHGQKVIVYIRDQYAKYHDKGYKFHLTKCRTIESATQNRRDSRYVMSKRTDGRFTINLFDDGMIVKEGLVEELHVCKNCLNEINYNDYSDIGQSQKIEIYDSFQLYQYFEKYKSNNLNAARYRPSETAPLNTYSNDFKEKSREVRVIRNYKCEKCSYAMNKTGLRKFAHVHHIDGDKSNNRNTNLKVLCIECHANEPDHGWMKSNPDYFEFKRVKSNNIF